MKRLFFGKRLRLQTRIKSSENASCEICYESNTTRPVERCGHSICRPCFKKYLETNILSGKYLQADQRCPSYGCPLMVSDEEVLKTISNEVGKKMKAWRAQALNEKKGQSFNEVHGCELHEWIAQRNGKESIHGQPVVKICQCGVVIEKNGGCIHMTCKACSRQFCWKCDGAWVIGHKCGRTGQHNHGNNPIAHEIGQVFCCLLILGFVAVLGLVVVWRYPLVFVFLIVAGISRKAIPTLSAIALCMVFPKTMATVAYAGASLFVFLVCIAFARDIIANRRSPRAQRVSKFLVYLVFLVVCILLTIRLCGFSSMMQPISAFYEFFLVPVWRAANWTLRSLILCFSALWYFLQWARYSTVQFWGFFVKFCVLPLWNFTWWLAAILMRSTWFLLTCIFHAAVNLFH